MTLDAVDTAILNELRKDARIPVTVLAGRVGRSRTAVQARINRLEAEGTIQNYTITLAGANTATNEIATDEIGAIVSVFVAVRSNSDGLVALFKGIPEVSSCLGVTGDASFVLLVKRCSSVRLKEIVEIIYQAEGVTKTDTVISLVTDF